MLKNTSGKVVDVLVPEYIEAYPMRFNGDYYFSYDEFVQVAGRVVASTALRVAVWVCQGFDVSHLGVYKSYEVFKRGKCSCAPLQIETQTPPNPHHQLPSIYVSIHPSRCLCNKKVGQVLM